jgi:uncharacterized protein YkwD
MHTMTLCISKKRALVGLALALPLLTASSSAWSQVPGRPPAGLDPELANVFMRHTHYRYPHCAPYLTWERALAIEAQRYASLCRRDPSNPSRFAHSGNKATGENLAWGTGLTGIQAVDLWYNEKSKYDFKRPGFYSNTGHFTQVVWKGTTRIGCGLATCGAVRLLVCRYWRPGNIAGQFPQNVSNVCR